MTGSDASAEESRPSLSSRPGWRLYFAARCVSDAGTALTWIAMPVLAYQLTGSGAWTAAVVAIDAIPYLLFGLLAGVVADLRDRQRVLVVANLVSAAALFSLPLSRLVVDQVSPWHVLVAAFAVQTAFVFADAAHFGALPAIVGRELVLRANSRLFGWIAVIECIFPAVGGLLMTQTSPLLLLGLDASSFLACALLLGRIRSPFSAAREPGDAISLQRAFASTKEGLTYLWSRPMLRDTTLANLLISVGTGAVFGQLVVWADLRHGIDETGIGLGLLFATLSLGGIVGGFGADLVGKWPPRAVIAVCCSIAAACGALAVWVPQTLIAFALLAAWQAGAGIALIIGVSLRQSQSPDRLVSRINTAGRMLALGVGLPLGALLSAVISEAASDPAWGMSVAFAAALFVVPLMSFTRAQDDDKSAVAPSVVN